MALNAYLSLKLDNTTVQGGVTQKGREGQILVRSLEWSFDTSAKGELKWVGDLDRSVTEISRGLQDQLRTDAIFNFWMPSSTGVETNYFRLTGTNGKVTSMDIWLPNTLDPSLSNIPVSMQVTMDFQTVTEDFLNGGLEVVIE